MDNKTLPLFVYGSLKMDQPNFEKIAVFVDDVSMGVVDGGKLYAPAGMNDAIMVATPNEEVYTYGDLLTVDEDRYDHFLSRVDGYVNKYFGDHLVRVTTVVEDLITEKAVEAYTYVATEASAKSLAELNYLESGEWAPAPKKSAKIVSKKAVQPAKKVRAKSPFYMERATEEDAFVWYLAYGSNMNVDRFLKYMNVGRTEDKFTASELVSKRLEMAHGVYYAKKSTRWGGGGVAFLDVDQYTDELSTFRIHKMTFSQFWSLACQENGSVALSVDWNALKEDGEYTVSQGRSYRRLVFLGMVEGLPVLTVTNHESYFAQVRAMTVPIPAQYEELGMLNPPSFEYLNTINAGVEQTAELELAEFD